MRTDYYVVADYDAKGGLRFESYTESCFVLLNSIL